MTRRMKLRDVEEITGHQMPLPEAYIYVSRNQSRQITANQALALSLMTRLNTRVDWLRLQACLVIRCLGNSSIIFRVSRRVGRHSPREGRGPPVLRLFAFVEPLGEIYSD